MLVLDDEGRENEGDLVLAAETATEEWMAWTVRHSSGYLCAPMPAELADRLELPLMVTDNRDPLRTAYTVSVDAARGVTTGISAADRLRTVQVLADPARPRPTSCAPGTCCRCGPGTAACSPGPGTPRRRSTSLGSPVSRRWASSASWSTTTGG